MKTKLNNKGFSLVSLLVSASLSSAVLYWAFSHFVHETRSFFRIMENNERFGALENVQFYLKLQLDGSRSFQNVSFQYDGSVAGTLRSMGPGFYVQPNADIDGNFSATSDRIILLSRDISAPYVEFVNNFPGPPLRIRSLSTDTIRNIFSHDDLLILSNIHRSEVLRIVATPANATESRIVLNPTSYQNTFSTSGMATSLQGTYAPGDPVFKAKFFIIGIEPGTERLLSISSSGERRVLVSAPTIFNVSYNLTPDSTRCSAITTAIDEFSRTNWNTLNTGSDYTCYTRIQKVQFSLRSGRSNVEFTLQTNI